MSGRKANAALTGAALIALSGCELFPMFPTEPVAPPTVETPEEETVAPLSDESRELAAYYRRVQDGLVAQGLLRTDGGGPDVPFSTRTLLRNFEKIALYEEYVTAGGRLVARETPSQIHRWEDSVRISVEFGASVPLAQRTRDRNAIISYANRLARVSDHPIRVSELAPNFHVFVVNEEERRALSPRLRQIVPGIDNAALTELENLPRSTFCLVFAVDPGNRGTYTKAVAIIRGEHPDLMRLSCIHEEIAQGLGLSNDSPAARPSIFNDDEEFGLLTRHDELLLEMLYDPRLRAGMSASEAMPIAEIIAAELMGGPS
ncbi:MAG: DUF2927 domain-containing protein [Rhodobacteraceae bacterium]|nr:DUF2927 domain-containing protein [Paracoccaceae bacterium]